MIRIEMTITNEGAALVEKELAAFLDSETERMVRAKTADDATRAYVILRSFLERVRDEQERVRRREQVAADVLARAARPTVRQARS